MMAPEEVEEVEEEEDPLSFLTPEQLQAYVDQYKKELALDRTKTSEGCKVVMEYILENMPIDPFIIGINSKNNPYIEKKDCALL
ncbi:unnamed protein product [Clavelina lepadiformis]|uniref:Guanine nucleotide-binding protein subunit gamma n=1 Tax=Clavelina lepadiformis TaxID=159417 RepID=A0ABP0GVV1_CLALP